MRICFYTFVRVMYHISSFPPPEHKAMKHERKVCYRTCSGRFSEGVFELRVGYRSPMAVRVCGLDMFFFSFHILT